ncbi:MAG: hypothetical protein HS126_33610 [Anaerolineales bacterium]|nr:hypothetical protein [Anaerolineales bacterium]
MNIKIPEKNKKVGVSYAVADDGIELPVIDITHPAFAFDMSEAELSALIDQMVLSVQRAAQTPAAVMQALAQQSILLRGMAESADTYTTGMMTYLHKLGPDNLGEGYASPLDRQWADPTVLRPMMDRIALREAVAVGSSEGGLFEFASDEEIVANLQALREGTPDDFVMVGPVVRDASTLDARLKQMEHVPGRPAIRFIGLEAFGRLVRSAGWLIECSLDGPMHQAVSLKKA